MHLLYTDETNYEQRAGDFFVYGGIMIDPDAAPGLSADIEGLRKRWGLAPEFGLKFNPAPTGMGHEQFRDLKTEVLRSLERHHCTLICVLVLHDVAGDPDRARLYGINTVCYHFDCWLSRRSDYGLALIDRFDPSRADSHLREKFSLGVEGLPYSPQKRLDRILGFHYSAWGQSHFSSACDIVLGSLRYALNVHTRRAGSAAGADALLDLLSPLFARNPAGLVEEVSLMFTPKKINVPKYRDIYQGTKDFLADRGIVAAQPITDDPVY